MARRSWALATAFALGVGLLAGPTHAADAADASQDVGGALRWRERSPALSPLRNLGLGMAYHPDTEHMVAFGGSGHAGGGISDTWVLADGTWTKLDLDTRPGGRLHMAMAYDAARHEIVVFGGGCDCAPTIYGDTWVFDGTQWTERTPGISPPRLYGASMAYDPVHQNLVLFGGLSHFEPTSLAGLHDEKLVEQNETWVWDGTTWEQKVPSTSPKKRAFHDMAYSKLRRQVVLFGGRDADGVPMDDTWGWDGEQWVRDQSKARISARRTFGMTELGRRVVLFGGAADGEAYSDETWILGRDGWQERSVGSPGARAAPGMAYDSDRHRVVLFGGLSDDSQYLNDTWSLRRRDRP